MVRDMLEPLCRFKLIVKANVNTRVRVSVVLN